jgi:hypothetical protein
VIGVFGEVEGPRLGAVHTDELNAVLGDNETRFVECFYQAQAVQGKPAVGDEGFADAVAGKGGALNQGHLVPMVGEDCGRGTARWACTDNGYIK